MAYLSETANDTANLIVEEMAKAADIEVYVSYISSVTFFLALGLGEPLERVDSFDVLFELNESVFNESSPGFQHRFVGLLFY